MSGLSEINQDQNKEVLTRKVNSSKKQNKLNLDVLFEKKAFCVSKGCVIPKSPFPCKIFLLKTK